MRIGVQEEMKIFIIRHAETTSNKKDIVQGWIDTPLSQEGKRQAEKLASRLKNYEFDFIYCSDLRRCKQTLLPIMKNRTNNVHYTKLLRERNRGIFQGRKRKYLVEWMTKYQHDFKKKIPKGESFADVTGRMKRFLKMLNKEQEKKSCKVNVR